MATMNLKQLLSVLLVVLIARPVPLGAAATTASTRTTLGSISSHGTVRVGDVVVPPEGTLFSGDQVQTELGSAVVRYREGANVRLGNETLASFSPSLVQLQKGQMSFRTASSEGPVFAASTLLLEPAAPNSAANVFLGDRKASVAVTEGTLKVMDPSGVQLASLSAGEARLFEEASAALPPPPSPAAAPQGGLSGSRGWILALGVAIAGTSLGIAGLVQANDADERADEAQRLAQKAQSDADALRTLVTTLQSQITALQSQATSLTSQITALQTKLASDTKALQDLAAAQAEVAAIQAQLSGVLANLAVATTPAQVQALAAQVSSLFNSLVTATNKVSSILVGAGQPAPPPVVPPVISPVRL